MKDEFMLAEIKRLKLRIVAAEVEIGWYVERAREQGVPWQRIADAMNISRQAAWEKYGRKE